ncbi:MAG TPA: isochorismatase family protein [Burkholderiales bacterium]|nr:isochorismatase family protein [Burkholderiales bacterium]
MKRTMLLALLVLGLALGLAAQAKPAPAKVRPALLVIDIQNAYLPRMDEKDVKRVMPMINYVIALFRDNGFPVIRVYHTDLKAGPAVDSTDFQFPKTTAVKPDDPRIIKNFPNAFKKTDLGRMLKEKNINTVFLCGLSATGCVLATYFGALDLDYDAFMVKGALISPSAADTGHVEDICVTIDYWPLKLLLENIGR